MMANIGLLFKMLLQLQPSLLQPRLPQIILHHYCFTNADSALTTAVAETTVVRQPQRLPLALLLAVPLL
jgi:hypothetical protein